MTFTRFFTRLVGVAMLGFIAVVTARAIEHCRSSRPPPERASPGVVYLD
jgi:hypothetical protein